MSWNLRFCGFSVCSIVRSLDEAEMKRLRSSDEVTSSLSKGDGALCNKLVVDVLITQGYRCVFFDYLELNIGFKVEARGWVYDSNWYVDQV